MQVSVHELKAHLSKYLADARRGQEIEVTSHRRVVGRLVGVPDGSDTAISRLLRKGLATWGGGKPVGAKVRLSGGPLVSDMLLSDRG